MGDTWGRPLLKSYWRIGNAKTVGLGKPGRRSKTKVNAKTSTSESVALDLSALADSDMAMEMVA